MEQANRFDAISHATLDVNVGDAPRTYQERLADGLCTRSGCPELVDEANECPKHLADTRKRKRRSRLKNRRLWTKKKLCLRCGGKRRRGRKWCATCLIREDRARSLASHKPQDKTEGRITREVDSPDGYARTRYHGQPRKGQQKRWQLDIQDLDDAIDRLQRAKQGVILARDAEEAQMPRVQRDEIRMAAMSQADHARRFIVESLERNGCIEVDEISEAAE